MSDAFLFQANIYPVAGDAEASGPGLAVCFSGGGSRALSCALGRLSGLRSIASPRDSQKNVLDLIPYVSSVSGGSWALVSYTYLPTTISDDAFLIQVVPPGQLVKHPPSVPTPQNVCYMAPNCLGNAPGQFNPTAIARVLSAMYQWGFLLSAEKLSWWWIAAVGELILKPFGLYDAVYDQSVDYIQPSKFFSLSPAYVQSQITQNNPTLTPDQFYLNRRNYRLFVNFNVMQDYNDDDTAQVPVQAAPTVTSVLGKSPDGSIVGGGSVESFGFTSTLVGPGSVVGRMASVTLSRRYSLCDITGCSSAFFAEMLLQYIDTYLSTDLQMEIAAYLEEEGYSEGFSNFVAGLIVAAIEGILNYELVETIPKYNFWPVGATEQQPPPNTTYGFSDGGSFDNTGILGVLAQTGADRIIAFINSSEPISVYGPPPTPPGLPLVQVSGMIALVFGSRCSRTPTANSRPCGRAFTRRAAAGPTIRAGSAAMSRRSSRR
jgi:hypothetical protein